jgi:RNA polymerase sigma-70 factor (ECF subfamily)
MTELTEEFEEHRKHLLAVAYRMLGSTGEADDAVQEAWLRLSRSDSGGIDNLRAWLTTVVARVSLDMLRSRASRREEPMSPYVPDPIVSPDDGSDPEHEAMLADSVGLALLVVLETLAPPERLAFVLHDMFAVPFDEIAPIIDRTPVAARQLASRARRRVRGAATGTTGDLERQREVVQAFLAASREGDFEALLRVLDPDVVLRVDRGAAASMIQRGVTAVTGQAFKFSGDGWVRNAALVNGGPGLVMTRGGRVFSVIGFTVVEGRIAAIDILADQERLRGLDVSAVIG